MNPTLAKILPHLGAYLLFVFIGLIYFKPIVFDNKTLAQGDNIQARGVQKEIKAYQEKQGVAPLWTNQIFIGMPTFQIMQRRAQTPMTVTSQLVRHYQSMMTPHTMMIWAMLGFYIALLLFKVDWRYAILGALSFGLLTHQMVLTEAGHSTKVFALTYVAPILAAAWRALRGDWLKGGVLFAFFLGLQLLASHLQIVYYTGLLTGTLVLAMVIEAVRKQQLPRVLKGLGAIVLATTLAATSDLPNLWATQEYVEETIRGGSELTKEKENTGLDRDYVFNWSYGTMETFTLVVPNFYGGSSSKAYAIEEGSETAKVFRNIAPRIPQNQAQQLVQATSAYWGTQPFTAGPVYLGAVAIFLFFLGVVLVKSPLKGWLIGSSIFFIFLSWGKNFAAFNDLMFDYFPFYNKFRAVSMTLDLVQVLLLFTGILGLKAFFELKDSAARRKALIQATGLAAGLVGLVLLYSFTASYQGQTDQMLMQANLQQLVDAMHADRAADLRGDAFRSLAFIALAAGALWLWNTGKLKSGNYVFVALAALTVGDLWMIDRRYIGEEQFREKQEIEPQANPAQQQAAADTDPHFRVMDLTGGNLLQSARGAYFNKTIGGYHPAKPGIFQEFAEHHFYTTNANGQLAFNSELFNSQRDLLSMFNTKYFIYDAKQAVRNTDAFGHAWLVDQIELVANADEEIDAVKDFNLRTTAVTQRKNEAYVQGLAANNPSDNIRMLSYNPDSITYQSNTQTERLAVFPEIYYPPHKGWKVYIDGKLYEPSFIKVNYLLRGLRIPAGQHTIKFAFEPASYAVGTPIQWAGSLIIFGLLLFVGYRAFPQWQQSTESIDEYLSEAPKTPTQTKTKKRR